MGSPTPSRSISPDPDATGGRGDQRALACRCAPFSLGVFRSVGAVSDRCSSGRRANRAAVAGWPRSSPLCTATPVWTGCCFWILWPQTCWPAGKRWPTALRLPSKAKLPSPSARCFGAMAYRCSVCSPALVHMSSTNLTINILLEEALNEPDIGTTSRFRWHATAVGIAALWIDSAPPSTPPLSLIHI